MGIIFELILLFAVIGATAYYRVSAIVWAPIIAVTLFFLTTFAGLPMWLSIPAWVILAVAAATFLSSGFREKLFMRKTFALFKKLLPPISQTEQEALDAGDVWWEGDLFRGTPDWDKLMAMPKPTLRPDEQAFIDHQVATLCRMLDDWKIVQEDRDLPEAVWEYIRKEGFFGMAVDKQYGGLGFSALAHSTVVSRIATRSLSAAVNVMVPNSLGPAELIYHYGTDEQKNYYLPRLAKGVDVPCFGLTAAEAGSDAGAIPDTGVICRGMHEGKEVLGMRLNFDKRYITLAPMATIIGVAFKLYDPDHLLGDKTELGITLGLVPASHPNVTADTRHFPMNMAFLNGPVRGKDVFVPLDNIIGGPKMAGHGWRMLMECLSIGRSISLPALSNAVGTVCYRMTGAYARIRKQFKLPIAHFEGVEEALARIAGNTYQLEAARLFTAGAVDQKIKPAVASAIAKYNMTEMSRQVMNDAFDVHAGRAIQMGPRNYLGHGHYATPVSITVEGANILTRNLIIFGQGAMRCHPYIRQEIAAINLADQKQAYAEFDKLLCSHLGYTASNAARTFVYGLTNGRFIKVPAQGKLAWYYRQLSRMSTALALVADIAMMILGGDLKRKERLSARLGDVLSNLYLGSAVLKYFHDEGQKPEDLPYVEWCIQTNLNNIQNAFTEFFENFPNRFLAKLLSFWVFPIDHTYKHRPSDKLDHKIVEPMLTDSGIRQRLGAGCAMVVEPTDPMGRMEIAFQRVLQTQDLERRLQQALRDGKLAKQPTRQALLDAAFAENILSSVDIRQLHEADAAVADAIAVDEFRHEQLTGKTPSWLKKAQKVAEMA
jgi:alkylation response protein AidB-like acyl-CoA dehydrogenase